jgi:hypothetical protein
MSAGGGTDSGDGNALVTFDRTGGIGGVRDHLVVTDEGKARVITKRVPEGREITLDQAEMAELRRVLEDARFDKLQSSSKGSNRVPDAFHYVLEHDGHKVTITDEAVPARLRPVVTMLQQITDRAPRAS